MGIKNPNDEIRTVKTGQFRVKVTFEDVEDADQRIKTVKNVIFEKLKSNCVSIHASKNGTDVFVALETAKKATALDNFNFEDLNVKVSTKLLTNNDELDKRKVKLWRPSTAPINTNDLKHFLRRYTEMEEFDEVRSTESRKRIVIVAFSELEGI